MDFDSEIAARGAHRVTASTRNRLDFGEVGRERRVDDQRFTQQDATPLTVANIRRGGTLTAMEADDCRPQTLILDSERAAWIALGAERLEARQESFESLLTPLEEVLELTFAASGDLAH